MLVFASDAGASAAMWLADERAWIGGALCLLGGALALIGTLGVLRFPDVYTRLHAASVTDTAAATLAILGMIVMAPDWIVAVKLAAIWLFLFLTGPTASHALANAALTAGLTPKAKGTEILDPPPADTEANGS